jgi:hypothetical protein
MPAVDLAGREVRPVQQHLQPDARRGRLLARQRLLRRLRGIDGRRIHFRAQHWTGRQGDQLDHENPPRFPERHFLSPFAFPTVEY